MIDSVAVHELIVFIDQGNRRGFAGVIVLRVSVAIIVGQGCPGMVRRGDLLDLVLRWAIGLSSVGRQALVGLGHAGINIVFSGLLIVGGRFTAFFVLVVGLRLRRTGRGRGTVR